MGFPTAETGQGRPQDIFELLERNFNAQKPLLDGAHVYRGTSNPIQEGGVVSDTVMHATLMPKIATQYTHNYMEGQVGYIGAYPLDRNATFHKDWGLEKSLNGQGEGRTVAQAEELLRPKVAELAAAKDEPTRLNIKREIENTIQRELYETALPLDRARSPSQMFYYTGQPNAHSNKEATLGMAPIREHNSSVAKEDILNKYRGPTTQTLREISLDPSMGGLSAKIGPAEMVTARKAMARMTHISQAEFSKELRTSYGQLSVGELAKAAVEHPVSKQQKQMEMLGTMLRDSWHSDNPQHREVGHTAAKLIAALPESASFKEVSAAMGQAAQMVKDRQGAGHSASQETQSSHAHNHGAHAGRHDHKTSLER